LQGLHDAQLLRRLHAGEDGDGGQLVAQFGLAHAFELGAVDGPIATVPRDAEFARDRQAGELVVAGDHDRADARGPAFGDRESDLLARWVDLADQAQQARATRQGVEAGRSIQGVIVQHGKGQHAQCPLGHALGRIARRLQGRGHLRPRTAAARPRAHP
jgi:hypothetical protein